MKHLKPSLDHLVDLRLRLTRTQCFFHCLNIIAMKPRQTYAFTMSVPGRLITWIHGVVCVIGDLNRMRAMSIITKRERVSRVGCPLLQVWTLKLYMLELAASHHRQSSMIWAAAAARKVSALSVKWCSLENVPASMSPPRRFQ